MNLRQLQSEHSEWLTHNFPNQQAHDALLGLVEEVGELAHAHLKHQQGIRDMTHESYALAAADAVGDIIIYLASYCNSNGLDLELCVSDTWRQVKARDWQERPSAG